MSARLQPLFDLAANQAVPGSTSVHVHRRLLCTRCRIRPVNQRRRGLPGHLGSLTLATVVDYESMVDYAGPSREPDRDRTQADSRLTAAADDLEPLLGSRPGVVVLAGKPATALQQHAHDERFDLVVIGRRGRGITKRLVGSCATELARASSVPVVSMSSCPQVAAPTAARVGRVGDPIMITVVAPLDGSEFAERALRPACALAARLKAASVMLVYLDTGARRSDLR
ncbi:MAG: universal stress protein [Acidimicrobiales bacterium]